MADNANSEYTQKNAIVPSKVAKELTTAFSAFGKRCEFFEKEWLNCASKLGVNRAIEECSAQRADLDECSTMEKSLKRYHRMQEERQKRGLPFQESPPYDVLPVQRFKNVIF